MPFRIPADCDPHVIWSIFSPGKSLPAGTGRWSKLHRKVTLYFTFSWQLEPQQLSDILAANSSSNEDLRSKKAEVLKAQKANPRWFVSSDHFLEAVKNGDANALRSMLRLNPRLINTQDAYGSTALIRAVFTGHVACLQMLLASPEVDVNKTNADGNTALIQAVINGHVACLQMLLASPEVDVNIIDADGYTALMWALIKGREDQMKMLLAHPNIDVNITDADGDTALMLTLIKGRDDQMKMLLAHPKIDVNKTNADGYTALMLATINGNEAVVRMLLTHSDIDVNITDADGRTALMIADHHGAVACKRMILEYYWERDMVRDIIAHSANIRDIITRQQICEKLLSTDLFSKMEAAEATPFIGPMAQQFVTWLDESKHDEMGDNCSEHDLFGNTLLIYAAAKNQIDVVKMLLNMQLEEESEIEIPQKKRIDLHHTNMLKESAIHVAAKGGHTEICFLLLREKEPQVGDRYYYCKTACEAAILASANGHADLFTKLIAVDPLIGSKLLQIKPE
ncbi:MAG: hypothetical protein KR126chlam2_00014 [Chlamydiae bacterium]|nr:hypothetical protein [Chlamydiota bacterium]